MKEYYVVNNILEGIKTEKLKPGNNYLGELVYYYNPNATDQSSEYYDIQHVFEDYDDALAYFANTCASKLAHYKAQIRAVERIKNQVLES